MKWENRNINVKEQANTAKFSKLESKETLLRLLELFFHDALVDMIVGYTKSYCCIEKASSNSEITNETFHLLLGTLILSGFYRLPDREMD